MVVFPCPSRKIAPVPSGVNAISRGTCADMLVAAGASFAGGRRVAASCSASNRTARGPFSASGFTFGCVRTSVNGVASLPVAVCANFAGVGCTGSRITAFNGVAGDVDGKGVSLCPCCSTEGGTGAAPGWVPGVGNWVAAVGVPASGGAAVAGGLFSRLGAVCPKYHQPPRLIAPRPSAETSQSHRRCGVALGRFPGLRDTRSSAHPWPVQRSVTAAGALTSGGATSTPNIAWRASPTTSRVSLSAVSNGWGCMGGGFRMCSGLQPCRRSRWE